MNRNIDFFYAPGLEANQALGSAGASSMPEPMGTGIEDGGFGVPTAVTEADLEVFARQTQRLYGKVSDPHGTLSDRSTDQWRSRQQSNSAARDPPTADGEHQTMGRIRCR